MRSFGLVSVVLTLVAVGCGDETVPVGPTDAGAGGSEVPSPHAGEVVVNELLVDGTTDEDANQDGTIDAMEDEFVELVNVSDQTVDLSGWTLVERDWDVHLPRHTFVAGTQLAPNGAAVVFGGGNAPDSTAAVLYVVSSAQDPGTPYGLDLDNDGDRLLLLDHDGLVVDVVAYGNAGDLAAVADESMTRDPDLTGDFKRHTQAAGASGAVFSPGTRVDGSAF